MKENTQHNIEDEEPVSQKGKLKKFLYPLLFAIVIIGCSAGYYIYSVNTNYFSTDNAKVTAKLYSVMPVTNGKLISWDVENGPGSRAPGDPALYHIPHQRHGS